MYSNNYIIPSFNSKYKGQWINVIFLQDEHNINAVFLKYTFCLFVGKLVKCSVNRAFILVFKHHTHKLYF